MDIGNMHKKFRKDCAWFRRYPSGQTDTQTLTDKHTHHNTSQPLLRVK